MNLHLDMVQESYDGHDGDMTADHHQQQPQGDGRNRSATMSVTPTGYGLDDEKGCIIGDDLDKRNGASTTTTNANTSASTSASANKLSVGVGSKPTTPTAPTEAKGKVSSFFILHSSKPHEIRKKHINMPPKQFYRIS